MSRLRIVLDTNMLISAALKPLGRQALVVNLVAFRAVELCVSEAILADYREVFSRPKFARLDLDEVSRLLALIEREATMVAPTERHPRARFRQPLLRMRRCCRRRLHRHR